MYRPFGNPELPRLLALLAEPEQQPALRIEDLHGVEHRVRDVDVALTVDGDALRRREVAGAVADLAELVPVLAVGVEHLDPEIQRIRHDEVAVPASARDASAN